MNATRFASPMALLKAGDFRWLPPADGTLFALG
jgi:hypothetical protein